MIKFRSHSCFGLALAALELFWLPGCVESSRSPIEGSWVLSSEQATGFIDASGGGRAPGQGCATGAPVRVGLWGPTWGTPGVVAAQVEEGPGGLFWFYLPLETGVGEGEAALRLQGTEARLPLGGRRGEMEIVLEAIPGEPAPGLADRESAAFRNRIQLEQQAWARGSFRLEDDGRLVGDLQLRGELPPLVAVYDRSWLTPTPTPASRSDDGGDLLLTFTVEPSLEGEPGLVRINVPTREVVVPMDLHPDPADRHLQLVPGAVSAEERDAAIARAQEAAGLAESEWIAASLPALVREATRPDGSCATPEEVDPAWPLLLRGYAVRIEAGPRGCEAWIEPVEPQHRRRWQGRVGREGIIEGGLLD